METSESIFLLPEENPPGLCRKSCNTENGFRFFMKKEGQGGVRSTALPQKGGQGSVRLAPGRSRAAPWARRNSSEEVSRPQGSPLATKGSRAAGEPGPRFAWPRRSLLPVRRSPQAAGADARSVCSAPRTPVTRTRAAPQRARRSPYTLTANSFGPLCISRRAQMPR